MRPLDALREEAVSRFHPLPQLACGCSRGAQRHDQMLDPMPPSPPAAVPPRLSEGPWRKRAAATRPPSPATWPTPASIAAANIARLGALLGALLPFREKVVALEGVG